MHALTLISQQEFAELENPSAHFLQTALWGGIKSQFSWKALYTSFDSSYPILILERLLPFGQRVLYVPRGPIIESENLEVLTKALRALQTFARKRKATCLRIEPEIASEDASWTEALATTGFDKAPRNIQFKGTMLLDLTLSPTKLLESFKEKTRYNTKVAQKKGVKVLVSHQEKDLHVLYDLFRQTGIRKGYRVNPWQYYKTVWTKMIDAGQAELFQAYHEEDLLSTIMPYVHGEHAWYTYNADTGIKRNLMGNTLALWEVILWLKSRGVTTFDLWGIPVTKEQSDSFTGVLRYKRGFSGKEVEWLGCWDYYPNRTWKQWYGRFERVYNHWVWQTKHELVY